MVIVVVCDDGGLPGLAAAAAVVGGRHSRQFGQLLYERRRRFTRHFDIGLKTHKLGNIKQLNKTAIRTILQG